MGHTATIRWLQSQCEGSKSESSLVQGLRREKGGLAAHWLETELLEAGPASSLRTQLLASDPLDTEVTTGWHQK